MAEEKTESKKESNQFELVEVATQTTTAIKNSKTGELLTVEQALVAILNEVQNLRKAL